MYTIEVNLDGGHDMSRIVFTLNDRSMSQLDALSCVETAMRQLGFKPSDYQAHFVQNIEDDLACIEDDLACIEDDLACIEDALASIEDALACPDYQARDTQH